MHLFKSIFLLGSFVDPVKLRFNTTTEDKRQILHTLLCEKQKESERKSDRRNLATMRLKPKGKRGKNMTLKGQINIRQHAVKVKLSGTDQNNC